MPRRAEIHPTDPVARRLFFSREALGFRDRQGAYAEKAGISPNAYNAYERAQRNLTMESARRLERKFGLTLEWLFDGIPDRLPHGTVQKLEALGAFAAPLPEPAPAQEVPSQPQPEIKRSKRVGAAQ